MDNLDLPADSAAALPPTFNGWAVYGFAYCFAVVRLLHRLVEERDAEIARLVALNAQLTDRLLMRQSVTPMTAEMRERGASADGLAPDPSVRRAFKSPIAAHNAAARAQENTSYLQRRALDEERRRQLIREDEARQQEQAN